MRLGVLDIGSNTAHLLVVDAYPGAPPTPALSSKTELQLASLIEDDGRLSHEGAESLMDFVGAALAEAEDKGVEEVFGFATSAIRDATNGEDVVDRIRTSFGIPLEVLSGEEEARVTFLAARRWYGWSTGRLLVLDIGGGSLEVATGRDEEPDAAFSVPLGVARLSRQFLNGAGDPLDPTTVQAMRKHVRTCFAREAGRVTRAGAAETVVGSSKTFRTLARIAGAAPSADGPYVRRTLKHRDVQDWLPRLAEMDEAERAELPAVTAGRSRQVVAGAVVADAVMDLLQVDELDICPWALREGLILRRLDQLPDES
jgi:exopolyphosphatase/guanosine-5'-triphosphate,3'-diphosphate pyrophosphatase